MGFRSYWSREVRYAVTRSSMAIVTTDREVLIVKKQLRGICAGF